MKKQIILIFAIMLSLVAFSQQNIIEIEYYYDAEPTIGNGTNLSVTSGNLINQTYSLDISSLSSGFHFIYVRAKNDLDIWGLYDKKIFYISEPYIQNISPIIEAEYYIDTDLGIGNGTTIPLSNPTNDQFTFDITAPSLTDGEHLLFIRVKNNLNVWSLYDVVTFTVDSSLSITNTNLDSEIRIYPNPVNNKIILTSKEPVESYKIIDVTGKTIIQNNIESNLIDTSMLETGTYFLVLKSNKNTSVKKIIKQ